MKPIVNIFIAMLITISAFGNGNPTKTTFLLENESISVSIDKIDVELFASATYNHVEGHLSFDLTDEVTFVQIFDNNAELMFQLPVMSNKLKIGSSLFENGNYKLGFMMKGDQKIHFTDIKIGQFTEK